ncbi:hypothetical protein RFI_31709 [Reticulomyxa filosa]|uniref:Uncharacterized protein n=1 Tax=Reticulomyxa filosa TaxID=46433 RepID=X6LWC8_RETFI|nr:hypothetical protein RFI_31709 [Reticulomyxa filosa]|eukprot:ETO05686.1 hypothetical protein RFI_31709 [Reticulomyxa filosa]
MAMAMAIVQVFLITRIHKTPNIAKGSTKALTYPTDADVCATIAKSSQDADVQTYLSDSNAAISANGIFSSSLWSNQQLIDDGVAIHHDLGGGGGRLSNLFVIAVQATKDEIFFQVRNTSGEKLFPTKEEKEEDLEVCIKGVDTLLQPTVCD